MCVVSIFNLCCSLYWGCYVKHHESKVKVLAAQSPKTLHNPVDCSPPGSSVHGTFQARILKGVVVSFSRGSSWPRDWTQVPHITGRFFTIWATREALKHLEDKQNTISITIFLPFLALAHYSLHLESPIPPASSDEYYPPFSSGQLLSHVQLFVTPWPAAHQASLSITNSCCLLKLMSIESLMPSNYLILYYSLLLPPSIFSTIRVFPDESVLYFRWPKYWSFSFSISLSNE